MIPSSLAPTNPLLPNPADQDAPTPPTSIPKPTAAPEVYADVIQVSVSGKPGDYRFSVEISSPDTGCDQYADWWEVVSPDGRLIYRQVLLHSHSGEQPFTRSGDPVDVQPDETLIVRGHMNGMGYGGAALKGSVSGCFATINLEGDFGADLARQGPLPTGCVF